MKILYTTLSAAIFGAVLSFAGVSFTTKPGITAVIMLWFCIVNAFAAEKMFEKQ